jgi:alpha-mannosidase
MVNIKRRRQKQKLRNRCVFYFLLFTFYFALWHLQLQQTVYALQQTQTNELSTIADGGYVTNWLVSSVLPAEIDAGAWENFNRFNIERLPERDWLAPFGGAAGIKPQAGLMKATIQTQQNEEQRTKSKEQSGQPLPEVGAETKTQKQQDVSEISWREYQATSPRLDFYSINNGKSIGTAYAAAYIIAQKEEYRFIETDGFLGSIWLNGEKIYDGYTLNVRKVSLAKFRAGQNLLLVRATGITGDYWRKDGGWTALVRVWKSEQAANESAAFKPSGINGTIFYLEGFHVDPVYLQDQRGYSKITLSNMNQYITSLRADPNYGVFLSEIDYLKPYLDTHAEDREFLREAVKQGRVGTGGAYNQFNENTIGGEAIIRNILYGQAMHEAMLGYRAKSLSLWDVFGHAPQISQIAAKSGFNGIVWSKKITGFQPFFYDYALDGSRLLHRRVDYAYSFSGFGSGKNYSFDNFRRMTERKFVETRSFNSSVDLRINAADFTPPWTNLAGNVTKLEQSRPRIRVTGQAQDFYFDALNEEIKNGVVKPPVTSRDKVFFHVGVSMARSDLKVAHRLAENMTLTAERFGAIAYLRGARYPDLALDKAWRQIFFGSHHDAITGTPSDSAFLDLVHGYREAFELSKDALNDSLDFLSKQIDTNPKFKIQDSKSQIIPIVVFNPMSWTRTDVVRARVKFEKPFTDLLVKDSGGKVSTPRVIRINKEANEAEFDFVAREVPSLGYKTFYVVTGVFHKDVDYIVEGIETIENEFYRITVDPKRGGAIKSIYDKQAKREVVRSDNNHLANEIASLKEELTRKNVIYPAWELWTTGEKKFSTESAAKVSAQSSGDTQKLIIEGAMPNMQGYRQTIELHKGVKRIDFKTELINYKGRDELFVVNFPLNLQNGALVTEDRFGTVVRNSSKGFLDFKTNTDKLVSGAPVYSVNNWAEYGTTLNLKFVDVNGKTVSSLPFKPTALVRPHGDANEEITEKIVAALIRRGVSVTPFYDDNDAARRKDLPIEDSTMPKKLNDDIAYHGFRISIGNEKENAYTATLLRQVDAKAKQDFEARIKRDGYAYLFLFDKDVPEGWQPVPALVIAGKDEAKTKEAVDKLLEPLEKYHRMIAWSPQSQDDYKPGRVKQREIEFEKAREEHYSNSLFIPIESFVRGSFAPESLQVPDYGVALINNGTAGVSLEQPDTLTLFLTHTALWPGVNLPFEFVPENKTHVFTYALYPHEKDWREANTVRVGYDFNNPSIARQAEIHEGDLPSQKSFIEIKSDNVVVSALKLGGNPQASFKSKESQGTRLHVSPWSEDKRPFILRVYETEGDANAIRATTDFYVEHGDEIDLLEQKEIGAVGFADYGLGLETLQAFEIKTYKLFTKDLSVKKTISQNLGAQSELVQPVFSRYWLHNMGAAPIGNDAVKISLRPVEQMGQLSTFGYDDKYNQGGITTTAVRVSIVNNYQDRNVKGEAVIEVAEGWRAVPDRISYDIAANGSFTKDVAIVTFPVKKGEEWERASGLVKARIEHEGQTFQDVLGIGKPFLLEWKKETDSNGVRVKIKNPTRQRIEGAVALIMPLETWAGSLYSMEQTAPREQGFSVGANEEIVLNFPITNFANDGAWRVARIAYNGHVQYQ